MSEGDLVPNTLNVPARARQLAYAHDEAELRRLLRGAEALLVLGGGSNVVLNEFVDCAVCLIRNRGIQANLARGQIEVTAAAGESWHGLVRYCLGRGFFGLENLALIPGSVGAAPLQNIGAYGVELAQRLVRLRAMRTSDGQIRTFSCDECDFGYRDSWFKSAGAGEYVVLDVTLGLSAQPELMLDYPDLQLELRRLGIARPTPIHVAEAVIRVRRRKLPDPRHIGNAGSFFKNPIVSAGQARRAQARGKGLVARAVEGQADAVKLSAAQLIDQAQCKSDCHGGAAVWARQPLVLVNRGGATGADFVALAAQIRNKVGARFGIWLETEPRLYGF
jgi:UDP-N-acetylmuramate dehydrogenase